MFPRDLRNCQVHKLLAKRATGWLSDGKGQGHQGGEPVGIRARELQVAGVDPGPGLRMEALKLQG